MKGKIRVFCRLRPLNDKELAEKEKNIVCSPDEFTVAHPWKDDKSKQHLYDRVFDANTTQEEVFEDTKVNFSFKHKCFPKIIRIWTPYVYHELCDAVSSTIGC